MPNGANKKLNFVAKVYDPTAKEFKPIYIAPDATDKVQGDVKLSDATNSTLNAAEGMTAATPAAVKAANDNANNKLDKTTTSAQTVKSAVTFSGLVTGSAGFKGNLTGNVTGNADTATALKTARTISVKSGNQSAGSATFNGTGNVTITIPTIDGTTIRGTIPLTSIPQGALDRVVSYASISAAVSAWTSASGAKPFDIGDTIRVTGTTPNVMYAVTADPSKTASYVEYAAGTATNAIHADEADTADKLTTARTIRTNLASTSAASFNGTANITPGVTGTLPLANGGTGATNANAAEFNIIGNPTAIDTDMTDNSRFAMVYLEPNASQGTFVTRTGTQIWTYVKGKGDSTYAAKSHTHANATTSAAGFLPKLSGSTTQYLRGDGTWATVNAGVTGVKGNAETSYRTGNVNLTPANIGAAAASHTHNYLPLGGGTLTGNLSSRQIAPSTTNSYSLGTSDLKWSNVYATTFTGNLTGNASTATTATNATTASKVNQTLTLSGDVTGSVSLNATGTRTMTTNIAASTVGFAELKSEVGTVYVGSDTPTDDSVKLWVKI